ncbi:MAG: isoaspartyl peptidase/L-asparaginase [Candidatus Marinimicrobia bacterium]|jgi:beta-aspartyl-peptidase (threonine type)|nr:isoaspartyl peptidase/L-asparaginase [Candidatus Neomarinimicrobiota bacterium]MBT3500716.1 isoaspartyl peptidase/L-asparaginase [Candidatus Neomarinimicrobiota bacterium]MBT3839564.1 isoaspartyl peptidase/L-asparaginase [Candidatus Neomarinimicrobiota bacterium]MBT3998906.1 isoaspartyl peptidase/L-asparaginase [Candidatus Neomarinimicrobiota bacterium]MBT4283153.1 isoaspartyl peptidase/L-asparaginase [Candidatus Neomarinimicrobiota bacterium]
MNRIIAFSFALLIILGLSILFKPIEKSVDFAIAIHGGAGTITRKNMTAETEAAYRSKLEEALNIGSIILENGGTSLDAVVAAISIMEDSELFNAGKGAVFTNAGTNELDASIMDGSNLLAGAVAGVKTVKNPITAARKVMENTWHVMLSGEGADQFAKEQNLEIVDPSYFYTQRRWDYLKKVQAEKYGTVGCVALDKNGNLAAGTSTGGLTNKRWGRIGDSPIIGAGTYANNKTCAVSGTGEGEFYIRGNVAYDVSAMMEYQNIPVGKAARRVINKLSNLGAEGGVIAMDSFGNISMPFNTEGMYRGFKKASEISKVFIYND